MEINLGFQILAGLALAFAIVAFARQLRSFSRLPRPVERALPKGDARAGLVYAFTLGMAPWAKESTRRHGLAYMRGIFFHLGIFAGLAILIASPWLASLPSTFKGLLAFGVGLGAVLGLAGIAMRRLDPNLKTLSTRDDYFSVLLVSLFLACAGLWLSGWLPGSVFYISAAVLCLYAPFSKIRHCLYYAAARFFYGRFVGSRGVLPHVSSKADQVRHAN